MSVTATNPKPITIEVDQSDGEQHLRSRRTLNRLAVALAGVAAAGLGQFFFYRASLWDGLLLYGIAIILFMQALAGHISRQTLSSPPLQSFSTALQRGWRRNFGVWLMLLALGISVIDRKSVV